MKNKRFRKKSAFGEQVNQLHVPNLSEFLTIFWHWNWKHILGVHCKYTHKKHTILMHIALIRSHYFAVICCALFAVHVSRNGNMPHTNKKLITFQCFVVLVHVLLFSCSLIPSLFLTLSLSSPLLLHSQFAFVGGPYAYNKNSIIVRSLTMPFKHSVFLALVHLKTRGLVSCMCTIKWS